MTSVPVVFIAADQPDDQYLYRQAFGDACATAVLYFFLHKGELLAALQHQIYPIPSLLIMDWDMNLHQGYSALASLTQTPIWQSIPVVIMASETHPVDEGRCQRIGYELVITKEMQYEKLVDQIRGLMGALV